jgi:hypothetical protein
VKIFVAIPVYDGKMHIHLVRSLLNEQALAFANGDDFQVGFVSGNAGIVQARNQLAHEFMEGDFDRLLFVDADVTWQLGDLLKLAKKPGDIVGGCYRYKQSEERYPMMFLDEGGELWANEYGLLEVKFLPTGFLAISRSVFEKFVEAKPERLILTNFGEKRFVYFQIPFTDTEYGEDFYFCKEWREMGGQVWLDPELALTHWSFDPTPHAGHIGNWLKSRGEVPACEVNQ